MRILVTGASGLVGTVLCEAVVAAGHVLIAWRGRNPAPDSPGVVSASVDLTDVAAAQAAVIAATPDVIVNCAALSQPAVCESNPALSFRLNVELPVALAGAASALGCRLLHLSSEQVFSGETDRPYRPEDPVDPRNVYGRHKVESEQRVAQIAGTLATVVRPPLMVGNSLDGTRSHHEQILAQWRAGQTPRMFTDELRQPCSTTHLAAVLLELCSRPDCHGLFHWAGERLVSRYDLLVGFRRRFGLESNAAPIAAQTRKDLPDVARVRPRSLPLDVSALAGRLGMRTETFDEMLATLRDPAR